MQISLGYQAHKLKRGLLALFSGNTVLVPANPSQQILAQPRIK